MRSVNYLNLLRCHKRTIQPQLETIGHFNIIQELNHYNDNISLWLAESNDGELFDILTIKQNKDCQSLVDRVIKNEILPLVNQEIEGIQKIILVDFDSAKKSHFIVYKYYENMQPISNPTMKSLRSLLIGLDFLKKQNRYGFVMTNETIITNQNESRLRFVGLFELFKNQNLLNDEFLAPELIEGTRPTFQSDIFSLFVCFKDILRSNNDSTLIMIFAKANSLERINRFSKYSDIIEQLDKVKVSSTMALKSNHDFIRVSVKQEDEVNILPIIDEMNNSCSILLNMIKSEERGQITGKFSTKSFSGKFNLNRENYIFIHYSNCNSKSDRRVLKDGFTCDYGFALKSSSFNCYNYFHEKWEMLNNISQLNKTKQDLLKNWQTLPDKEREYIEESAFKAEYIKRELSKSNPANIRFQLSDKFRDWETIKELKRNEIYVSVNDKFIGQIQDYNSNDCFLVIKDAKITLDEIPENGELQQDVKMKTGQFKKQVEACKKFENRDIVNPVLCGIIATPERIPQPNRIDIDYEGFKREVINPHLKSDNTQREAVIEALHYKPIYLIQGPPGTGKTTIIVELIQQIIKSNRNAKILVTSQGHDAIDNVFKKILTTKIPFIRLAGQDTIDDDKVSKEILPHTYLEKIKNWVSETQTRSDELFNSHFKDRLTDKALVQFYNFYSNINKNDDAAFVSFRNLLLMQSSKYIKDLFQNAKTLREVETIFNSKLSKEFQVLKKIQKDWFAFISNADSDDGEMKKSLINDGSSQIDIRTAFVKSLNVIGSTCIHIASVQYSKINFRFDYVIMDESSKATPAECLVPINMGQNIVLIGDHKQLPPIVTREDAVKRKVKAELTDEGLDFEKTFGVSLFEKLIDDFENNPSLNSNVKMLDIQYRMPRQIGNLISNYFYESKLNNPDLNILTNYDEEKFHELRFKNPKVSIFDHAENKIIEVPASIVFVSTSTQIKPYDNDNKFDRRNYCNKKAIIEILTQLNSLYPQNLTRQKPFTIGIIAGYRGQVNLLQEIDLLQFENFVITENKDGKETKKPLIEINTVDKFQGAERDIIIYDIVKSSSGSTSIGFLDDYRRINVAFSRVKRLLIVVGDSEYILKRATLNPDGKFKEFKLKEIVTQLQKQAAIVHNFNEMIQ